MAGNNAAWVSLRDVFGSVDFTTACFFFFGSGRPRCRTNTLLFDLGPLDKRPHLRLLATHQLVHVRMKRRHPLLLHSVTFRLLLTGLLVVALEAKQLEVGYCVVTSVGEGLDVVSGVFSECAAAAFTGALSLLSLENGLDLALSKILSIVRRVQYSQHKVADGLSNVRLTDGFGSFGQTTCLQLTIMWVGDKGDSRTGAVARDLLSLNTAGREAFPHLGFAQRCRL